MEGSETLRKFVSRPLNEVCQNPECHADRLGYHDCRCADWNALMRVNTPSMAKYDELKTELFESIESIEPRLPSSVTYIMTPEQDLGFLELDITYSPMPPKQG